MCQDVYKLHWIYYTTLAKFAKITIAIFSHSFFSELLDLFQNNLSCNTSKTTCSYGGSTCFLETVGYDFIMFTKKLSIAFC